MFELVCHVMVKSLLSLISQSSIWPINGILESSPNDKPFQSRTILLYTPRNPGRTHQADLNRSNVARLYSTASHPIPWDIRRASGVGANAEGDVPDSCGTRA